MRALILALPLALLAAARPAAACATDADCQDGLYCNGAERCERGTCASGPAPLVDDGLACTGDRCDETRDRVVHTPLHSLCSDGLFCNGIERCQPLLGCRPGNPPPIDDGIDCTIDFCDEATQTVIHEAQDVLCHDGNECTVDRCDDATGCARETREGPCDDRRACTTGDRCVEGVCLGTPATCGDGVLRHTCREECDDGNARNWDGCSAVCRIEAIPRLARALPSLQAELEGLVASRLLPDGLRGKVDAARAHVGTARWWIERRDPVMYPVPPALAQLSYALDALETVDPGVFGLGPLVQGIVALSRDIALDRLEAVECRDPLCDERLTRARRLTRRAHKRERRGDLYRAADLYKDAWSWVANQP